MDFGMPYLIETVTLEDCVKLCTELEINFIELNMNFPQCQLPVLFADELNWIKKENNIYFTIHLDENLNVCDFNSCVRNAYLETVTGAIVLAKKIKAPIINMHLAKGIYITLPKQRVFLFQQYNNEYRANLLIFRELCEELIGGSEIKIAIENTDGFADYEKSAIEMLLESKCFGLTLDIGHSHRVQNIDMDFYEKYKNRLVHMHAHDAKGKNNHLAFGEGEIDLNYWLEFAKKADVRVVLETKTVEALKRTVNQIKQHSILFN